MLLWAQVCSTRLYTQFQGEQGVDEGGLYRDMFSAFWMELEQPAGGAAGGAASRR